MKSISRLFAGLATNLKNNTFFRAKIKLTLFYAGILFVIVVIFSIFVYIFFINYIAADLEADQVISAAQAAKMLEMARTRLNTILIFSDIGVLAIITFLGYFLAGRTLRPIERSLKDQKRFVSDSAHELRTPLSVMKIAIDTVNSGRRQTLKEYKELTGDLSEELDKLIDLSESLMFLARSGSGKIEDKLVPLDICSICGKQIRLIRPYAAKKSIEVIEDIESPCYIKGNENQLKRLLINLLKNAIDYNKKGGKVYVSIKEGKRMAALYVRDTGEGIAPGHLNHIFERFYKADRSREESRAGSGLGLSIVKEIVEKHKGSISIKSQEGKGTQVIVKFRLLKKL